MYRPATLKDVLNAFVEYKNSGRKHIVSYPSGFEKEITRPLLTLYDLDIGDYKECEVKDIFSFGESYLFHVVYNNRRECDLNDKYYLIDDECITVDGIDPIAELPEDCNTEPEMFGYIFLPKRDRDYYLNLAWPDSIDMLGSTLQYERHIDKDNAKYTFEWDGIDGTHTYHLIFSAEDKYMLMTNPDSFANNIENSIFTCEENW